MQINMADSSGSSHNSSTISDTQNEEKEKDARMRHLMEMLRSKSNQQRSWNETSKVLKVTITDKRHQSELVEKSLVQKHIEVLQHSFTVKGLTMTLQRLENIAHQLGLRYTVGQAGTDVIMSHEMFYVSIVFDLAGVVTEVKIAHSDQPQNSPELLDTIKNGQFEEFQTHLEEFIRIYSITGDKKQKLKVLQSLLALENDLAALGKIQESSISGASNLVHKSPLGVLQPRSGGHAMKLTYFVHPYELLDKKSGTSVALTLQGVIEKKIGHHVSVTIEGGSFHKLQTMPLMVIKTQDGKSLPSFSAFTNLNSAMQPAVFILELPQPLPISLQTAHEIETATGVEFVSTLPRIKLLSLIISQMKKRPVDEVDTQDGLYVTLPDQNHCYFLNSDLIGVTITAIPFNHPTTVAKILTCLRQQALFNTLIGSCLRLNPNKDLSKSITFEVTAQSLQDLTVTFEHPIRDSIATAEFDLSDVTNIKCHIFTPDDAPVCPDDYSSKILQRCLSLPVTMRGIVQKARGHIDAHTFQVPHPQPISFPSPTFTSTPSAISKTGQERRLAFIESHAGIRDGHILAPLAGVPDGRVTTPPTSRDGPLLTPTSRDAPLLTPPVSVRSQSELPLQREVTPPVEAPSQPPPPPPAPLAPLVPSPNMLAAMKAEKISKNPMLVSLLDSNSSTPEPHSLVSTMHDQYMGLAGNKQKRVRKRKITGGDQRLPSYNSGRGPKRKPSEEDLLHSREPMEIDRISSCNSLDGSLPRTTMIPSASLPHSSPQSTLPQSTLPSSLPTMPVLPVPVTIRPSVVTTTTTVNHHTTDIINTKESSVSRLASSVEHLIKDVPKFPSPMCNPSPFHNEKLTIANDLDSKKVKDEVPMKEHRRLSKASSLVELLDCDDPMEIELPIRRENTSRQNSCTSTPSGGGGGCLDKGGGISTANSISDTSVFDFKPEPLAPNTNNSSCVASVPHSGFVSKSSESWDHASSIRVPMTTIHEQKPDLTSMQCHVTPMHLDVKPSFDVSPVQCSGSSSQHCESKAMYDLTAAVTAPTTTTTTTTAATVNPAAVTASSSASVAVAVSQDSSQSKCSNVQSKKECIQTKCEVTIPVPRVSPSLPTHCEQVTPTSEQVPSTRDLPTTPTHQEVSSPFLAPKTSSGSSTTETTVKTTTITSPVVTKVATPPVQSPVATSDAQSEHKNQTESRSDDKSKEKPKKERLDEEEIRPPEREKITVKLNTKDFTAKTIVKDLSHSSSNDTSLLISKQNRDTKPNKDLSKNYNKEKVYDLTSDNEAPASLTITRPLLSSEISKPNSPSLKIKKIRNDESRDKKRRSKYEVDSKRRREESRKDKSSKKRRSYPNDSDFSDSKKGERYAVEKGPTTIKITTSKMSIKTSDSSSKTVSLSVPRPGKSPSTSSTTSSSYSSTSPHRASLSKASSERSTERSNERASLSSSSSLSSSTQSSSTSSSLSSSSSSSSKSLKYGSSKSLNRSKSDSAAVSVGKMDSKLSGTPTIKLKPVVITGSSTTVNVSSSSTKTSQISTAAVSKSSSSSSTESVSTKSSLSSSSSSTSSKPLKRKNSLNAVIDKLTNRHSVTGSPSVFKKDDRKDSSDRKELLNSTAKKDPMDPKTLDNIRQAIIREGIKPSTPTKDIGSFKPNKRADSGSKSSLLKFTSSRPPPNKSPHLLPRIPINSSANSDNSKSNSSGKDSSSRSSSSSSNPAIGLSSSSLSSSATLSSPSSSVITTSSPLSNASVPISSQSNPDSRLKPAGSSSGGYGSAGGYRSHMGQGSHLPQAGHNMAASRGLASGPGPASTSQGPPGAHVQSSHAHSSSQVSGRHTPTGLHNTPTYRSQTPPNLRKIDGGDSKYDSIRDLPSPITNSNSNSNSSLLNQKDYDDSDKNRGKFSKNAESTNRHFLDVLPKLSDGSEGRESEQNADVRLQNDTTKAEIPEQTDKTKYNGLSMKDGHRISGESRAGSDSRDTVYRSPNDNRDTSSQRTNADNFRADSRLSRSDTSNGSSKEGVRPSTSQNSLTSNSGRIGSGSTNSSNRTESRTDNRMHTPMPARPDSRGASINQSRGEHRTSTPTRLESKSDPSTPTRSDSRTSTPTRADSRTSTPTPPTRAGCTTPVLPSSENKENSSNHTPDGTPRASTPRNKSEPDSGKKMEVDVDGRSGRAIESRTKSVLSPRSDISSPDSPDHDGLIIDCPGTPGSGRSMPISKTERHIPLNKTSAAVSMIPDTVTSKSPVTILSKSPASPSPRKSKPSPVTKPSMLQHNSPMSVSHNSPCEIEDDLMDYALGNFSPPRHSYT